jgi:hypothetical protein
MADKKLIEQLKAKSRIQQKVVRVPRWEIDVTIRELTFKQKREAQEAATREGGKVDSIELGFQMIARGAVEPTFTVAELRDLMSDEYSTYPLDWLLSEVQGLGKLNEGGLAEAEASFPDTEA